MIIMLEMIVFAVVLAVSQAVMGLLIMNFVMSEKFMKHYAKKMFNIMKSLENMDLDELSED